MPARTIYTFKNSEVEANHNEILKKPFILSARLKNLYEKGQGGDRPVHHEIYKDRTKDAQGYVYFLDVTTGILDGVPAANANSGIKLPLTIVCDFDGKKYGVLSREPLGSNSGDAHFQGLVQLGLLDKSGAEGMILAGGIFKGDGNAIDPKPHLLEFRNKSTSQNRLAIKYDELYLMVNYEPTLNRIFDIQRSIPGDLSRKIAELFIKELPIDEQSQIRGIYFSATENTNYEIDFHNMSEKTIKDILIRNLFLAAENDHAEIIERILALRDRVPKLSPYQVNKMGETILTVAEKHGHHELAKRLRDEYGDIDKIVKLISELFKLAKSGTVEQMKCVLNTLNQYPQNWLNYKNKDNDTLLMLAAINGNDAVLKFLLDQGADVEQTDIAGDSIFLEAVRNNAGANTIKTLLEYNKKFLAESADAFLIVALSSHADEKIKVLMECGADINLGLLSAVSSPNEKAINILIKNGADFIKTLELARKANQKTAIQYLTSALELQTYKNEIKKWLSFELNQPIKDQEKNKLIALSNDLQKCKNLQSAKTLAKKLNNFTSQNKLMSFFKSKNKYKAVNDVFDEQFNLKFKTA